MSENATTNQSNPDRLVSTPEAAEILGLSPDTLNTWRSTRAVVLPYVKIGRAVRYRLGDLSTLAASLTVR